MCTQLLLTSASNVLDCRALTLHWYMSGNSDTSAWHSHGLTVLALALSLAFSCHQWTELITRACTQIKVNLFQLTVGRLQVTPGLPRSKSANLARHSSVERSNTWWYFKVGVFTNSTVLWCLFSSLHSLPTCWWILGCISFPVLFLPWHWTLLEQCRRLREDFAMLVLQQFMIIVPTDSFLADRKYLLVMGILCRDKGKTKTKNQAQTSPLT